MSRSARHRPPLSPLRVTRKPGQRLWAAMWGVTAVAWVAAALLERSLGFVVAAIVWVAVTTWVVLDLYSEAVVGEGEVRVQRLGRVRVSPLAGARVKARRREIALHGDGDTRLFAFYPDRDQAAVGRDPRPIPAAEVVDALLARVEEADLAAEEA